MGRERRPSILRPPEGRLTLVNGGSWRADGGDSRLNLAVPAQAEGVAMVRLRLRLFKPLDPTTWKMATNAYRNQLDDAGLAAASALSVPMINVIDVAPASWPTPLVHQGLGVA